MGADPRYIGRRDGCTLMPPYLAAVMMWAGIRIPKETATMRFGGGLEAVTGSS